MCRLVEDILKWNLGIIFQSLLSLFFIIVCLQTSFSCYHAGTSGDLAER